MQSQQFPSEKENEQEVLSELNTDTLPQPQLTGHNWRQQGTMLICESCPFTHTSFLPSPDYQLYGIDERGVPMIRKIKF